MLTGFFVGVLGVFAVALAMMFRRNRKRRTMANNKRLYPFKAIKWPQESDSDNKDSEKRTVAVLGSTGFVGSHIIESLIESGKYRIYMLGRRFTPKAEKMFPKVDGVFQVDMMNYLSLVEVFKSVESVIDCAATLPTTFLTPDDSWHINVTGTNNVIAAAKEAGVKNLVFVSGLDVEPNPDLYKGFLRWLDSFKTTERAVTAANEEEVEEEEVRGLRTCVLQFGMIYGVRSKLWEDLLSGKMNYFPKQKKRLSFIPVESAAESIVKAEQRLNENDKRVCGKVLKLPGVPSTFKEFLDFPEWDREIHHSSLCLLRAAAHVNVFIASVFGRAPFGEDLCLTPCTFFNINEEQADPTLAIEALGIGAIPPLKKGIKEMVRKFNEAVDEKK